MAKHHVEPSKADTAPVHLAPYGDGPKMCELEKAKLGKMLAENIIEPARTKWAALILVVTKKDRTIQFCDDYSKINVGTKQDS